MQVGKLLGLRQRAAATACIYFKRFYVEYVSQVDRAKGFLIINNYDYRNSFVEFEPSLIAATTLYLSSKVEECNVRVDHIIKQMRSFGKYHPSKIMINSTNYYYNSRKFFEFYVLSEWNHSSRVLSIREFKMFFDYLSPVPVLAWVSLINAIIIVLI